MFWVFKLSFVVDILAFLNWHFFWLFFKKFGEFFSDHLVTLQTMNEDQQTAANF
jgi:hypothetical protein